MIVMITPWTFSFRNSVVMMLTATEGGSPTTPGPTTPSRSTTWRTA